MNRTRKLTWKPIRRGPVYCSSACGNDCKFLEYRGAVDAANRLSVRLGKGWKPRVWENLGWHYAAGRGSAGVYPCSNGYWASVSVGKQFMGRSANPRRAFLAALREADKAMLEWKRDREALG